MAATASVLLLNADLDPLRKISLRKALKMLFRRKAEVHEAEEGVHIGPYPKPKIIKLLVYVTTHWRYSRGPAWSKSGVLSRDKRLCGYCRKTATTVDHITPASKGGANSWLNTVACCYDCNQRKGNKTPAQAGMRLLVTPGIPTWGQAVRR